MSMRRVTKLINAFDFIGEPCRDRTGDPLLKRQMLYLLS